MSLGKALHAYITLTGHLGKTFFQMIRAAYKISQFPQPPVTIFGGSRLKMDSAYIGQAHRLAHLLVAENIPVLTGGGPGVMEAANCGAMHERAKRGEVSPIISIGIGVKDLHPEREPYNCCATTQITMDYFFSRKWILMEYSIGFVVFPGGFGTLDELFGILTLTQTKVRKQVPIILFGTEYWQPLIDWTRDTVLAGGLIDEDAFKLFVIVDDIYDALPILIEHCKLC